jgi:cytochrome c oxidase subunit 3
VNLFIASAGILLGVLVWWLAVRRLMTRPWESQAVPEGPEHTQASDAAPQRVGLWAFLAVITSLFGLFVTAYTIRMSAHPSTGVALGDWQPVPEPPILWLNLVLLVLGSAGMQVARVAAGRGQAALARTGLIAGGALAVLFLAGQLLAWRQLQAQGYYLSENPANAFFFVLTGLHGLHLLGGLLVWGRAIARLGRGGDEALRAVRLTIELCAVYWHFLLVVWLVLFGLLLIT